MAGILDSIKATPPYRFARVAKARLERWAFERGDLLDTGIKPEELGDEAPEAHRLEPSHWGFLRRALRRCEVRPTDVFLDLGSGKGRVVWQAAHLPFSRVIGVEIAPERNAVARRNVERNRSRLACGEIELVTADAGSYTVPDDVTFVYLYSPFQGQLFRRVISNITESLDRNARELTLIYANPEMAEIIEESRRFDLVHVLKGLRPDTTERSWVHVYSSRPAPYLAAPT